MIQRRCMRSRWRCIGGSMVARTTRSVAVSLYSLAEVYVAQGRLDDSASLHEESLAMYRRIHGSKDHSDVAASLRSLAQVYVAQGRLDDSASRHEESLAMYRRIHGSKDHSSGYIAVSLGLRLPQQMSMCMAVYRAGFPTP